MSAPHYDKYADFQNEMARSLAKRVDAAGFSGAVALDLGCGTGSLAVTLAESGAFRKVLAHDISFGMLNMARNKLNGSLCLAQAEAGFLPVRNGSLDLIVSNLVLQWIPDLPRTTRQMSMALKEGGRLMATTLGSNTFKELRESVTSVMEEAGNPVDASSFHRFTDERQLVRAAEEAGFEIEIKTEKHERIFGSFADFMRTLKRQGVQNNRGLSNLGLGRRGVMRRLSEEYQRRNGCDSGVRVTYEALHVDARLARPTHGAMGGR